MSDRSLARSVRQAVSGPGALPRWAAAAVLVGTVAAQHPNTGFSRAQRIDLFSALFPNWRFFAPTPAQHDYHFFYRTLSHDGTTSTWKMVKVIEGRRPGQIAWFPGRRPEKAVFDICSELIASLDKGFEELVRLPAYRMLRAYLRRRITAECGAEDVKGFQFTLARATGYDESQEPDILFASPYTPLHPGPEGDSRPRTRTAPSPAAAGRVRR
ncbi:hypothetical protein [Streptomyces sp. JJ36]|uniref:hypothetical protein n=1 Tax=Streptomyces sp. JJ36 TaxID=2736645 RepID=UPI001F44320D|nr:hypothetical protein [Streptomyces sp. JJ36]MCF6525231.1 hypothetical protein [Streptomyces sp. JJ36]